MLPNRFACHNHTALAPAFSMTASRSTCTVAGASGRKYARGQVLQSHRKDPALSVFMAKSADDTFVLKRVSRQCYDLSRRLAVEFKDSRRLRLHTDCNQEENVLIYPYFQRTLLALIQSDPEFPTEGRRTILRHVGEAIHELHDKDWVHLDVKPDNVLVNSEVDEEGHETVINAVLGDFDLTFKSENGQRRNTPYAVGNAMWRSPEGQTGKGMTKASDIYSFGLMCIYAMGGGDFLLLNDYQQLAERGITPEQEILTRHFCYFGPVPDSATKVIGDEHWSAALEGTATIADEVVKDEPGLRFERWGEELGPEAVCLILGMTALDPEARLEIDEVMSHPFWEQNA